MGFFNKLFKTEPSITEEVRSVVPDGLEPIWAGQAFVNTDRNALALPAFWRAVRLKSGTISTLPLEAVDGTTTQDTPLILARPNPLEDVQVTLQKLVNSLILRGNAYMLLGSFDELGYPHQAVVISPDSVGWSEQTGYSVSGQAVQDSEILHIRGFSLPGEHFGIGAIELFRRSISTMNAVEDFSGNYFKNSGMPSAVIKNSGDDLSAEDARLLKAKYIASVQNKREPIVFNRDIDLEPLTITAEESQFLATKEFSLTDIANMVGIPVEMIGGNSGGMTYENVSGKALNFTKFYLREDLVTIERAFSSLLPEGLDARFDLSDLLRADDETRYQNHQVALNAGIMTKDEIRAIEKLGPMDHSVVDSESVDPNIFNAITGMVRNGADPEAVFKALNLPNIPWKLPEEPTTSNVEVDNDN